MRTARPIAWTAAAGFSLLEMLVATILTGIILSAIATITAQWLPNWNRGFARVQRDDQIALALERLVADLGAAEYVASTQAPGVPIFAGTSEAVTLVRTALAPGAGARLELVRISHLPGDGTLIRSQADFRPDAFDPGARQAPTFTGAVVLLRSPFRLTLAFAGPDRVWRDSWQGERRLPRAVRLALHRLGQPAAWFSTTAPVHVELPAACVNAKSIAECTAPANPPGVPTDAARKTTASQ